MTQITDDRLVDNLVEYIRSGNHIGIACTAVGLSTDTFFRWRRIGREVEARIGSEPDAEDLRVALLQGMQVLDLTPLECRAWVVNARLLVADADAEAYALLMVRKAMPDQWQAAMTFLERRWPGRWRRRQAIDTDEDTPADTGIDEAAVLRDPTAMRLMHEALTIVASPNAKAELAKPLKREIA